MTKINLEVLNNKFEFELKHSWVFTTLTLLLGFLKLTGIINIPFWMVMLPVVLPTVFLVLLLLVAITIASIASLFPSKEEKEGGMR